MKSTKTGNRKIPAFTVLLLMAVLTLVGAAVLPTLEIRYAPEQSFRTVTVSFSWLEVSERIIESEATSKIEGVLSGMTNCTGISSVSSKGYGYVNLNFRKGTNMASTRFEIASRIRNIYPSLPDGVSYPAISLGIRGTGVRTDLIYVFRSALPSIEIENYISRQVLIPLSSIDGVESVSLRGAVPFEFEILFDAAKAESAGITADDIASAFTGYTASETAGLSHNGDRIVTIKIKGASDKDILGIPIKNIAGRIITIGNVATVYYKESLPDSYFRMNGLNTVSLSISTSPESNLPAVASAVKHKMSELDESFPEEISAVLSYDSSDYISQELDKIIFRTLLCVLILLIFVFLVYRSFRYLLIIFTILAVNILAAVVLYKITGLSIHIYTLAGITVSLGIIIDSAIVMTDHYSYYGNRSVFPALLGSTGTTIGALCIVGLLPDDVRMNLVDFSKVIIINLAVSLITAYAFIPSLLERFPVKRSSASYSFERKRRIVRFNKFYSRYIRSARKHRWIPVVILIAAFGIPLFLLPDNLIKWAPYADNRNTIDKITGSSFALFNNALSRGEFNREPGRDVLYINAGMPEGCTVAQLDMVVRDMENYLSLFDEIESFTTEVNSFDNAQIKVIIKPEYEKSTFPTELKSMVISMASNFGGATWRVYGINESYFNNNVATSRRSKRIILKGYNYDNLVNYAECLLDTLATNRRVSAPELMGGGRGIATNEFNVEYDFASLTSRNISPYRYFNVLSSKLYDRNMGTVVENGTATPVILRSSDISEFDLWHLENTGVGVDSMKVRLSEIGSIEKRRSGLQILRSNQSYELSVGFDFIGSYQLAAQFMEQMVDYINEKILPVGFRAEIPNHGLYRPKDKMRYAWLIILIIIIIYVICSMIFESLKLPFAVIMMIPVSFIGVFLTFGPSDFIFDQGGFASMVMLSGIVVNAGIYIVNEYSVRRKERNVRGREMKETEIKDYIHSFNHKIHPILLTIASTVLGLIPFLFDGPDEVFWFAFAAGTIGGLLFSLVALFLYLPLFCCSKIKKSGPESNKKVLNVRD